MSTNDIDGEEIEEIAKKVPTRTNELKQAIHTVCQLLQEQKDGCTICELREKVRGAKVSAHDLTDTLSALLLAEKATYSADKSRTVVMANKKLERFIIHSIYENRPACTVDELLQEAEKQGISPHDFRDALMGQSLRDRVVIQDGKVWSLIQAPPAKTQDFQRAPRGAKNERYYEEASPSTYGFPRRVCEGSRADSLQFRISSLGGRHPGFWHFGGTCISQSADTLHQGRAHRSKHRVAAEPEGTG
jgi:hypothetical protein